MRKTVLWDLQASAPQPPIYESAYTGWQTIVSGTVDFERSGIITVRWGLALRVEESFGFGLLHRQTRDFELRLELGGSYVYSYKPPQTFEPMGSAVANVSQGPTDMFVMIHLSKGARVAVRQLFVEILE